MMKYIFLFIVAIWAISCFSNVIKEKANNKNKKNKKVIQCNTSIMLNNPENIVNRISSIIIESKNNGLNNINIALDIRYTNIISVYKATKLLESNGITIKEEPDWNPVMLVFNISW